ncbi:hypothetical protein BDK51DRAFT_33372 [Blyttiomyces helicus]|uniref:Uncharacterized protein n=1 Tax=Blyttiomyces helicus TaxID=388810 RepID=A0A4P9VVL8_9FUNG|nr:hypothetical protein BDK51DRAFT_33372 [Blyttiomyces helicus]|eukprot:RKO83704.1 hypothetical protein BDK51DRAFT_33372 [Blyttiomyces helicus]
MSEDASQTPPAFSLILRIPSGDLVSLEIPDFDANTLKDLRLLVAAKTSLPTDATSLIHAGRILKDDDATLSSLGLPNGATIHVARRANNRAAQEASAAAGAGSGAGSVPTGRSARRAAASPFGVPAEMSEVLNNPIVRSMMESPQFLQTMLQVDPRISQLVERHPEMRQMLSDPDFLRQTISAMRNPSMMQEMMRNHDRQLSNIEAIPGGMNYLTSMYQTMQEPLGAQSGDTSTDEANRRYAEMLGVNERSPSEGINDQALPNPWAPRPQAHSATRSAASPLAASPSAASPFSPNAMGNPFAALVQPQPLAGAATATGDAAAPSAADLMAQLQSLQTLMASFQTLGFDPNASAGFGTQPAAAPAPATLTPALEPPSTRFASQIATMRDMGFDDESRSIRALLAAGGNVEAAITFLLDMP